MGTMAGYLPSGSIYFPGYRTGCAPDSDTSCVACEQRMHSLGLERSLVKTLVPPTSQLQVGLVSCSGEGSLGLLHIGHAVLPPPSLCPGFGPQFFSPCFTHKLLKMVHPVHVFVRVCGTYYNGHGENMQKPHRKALLLTPPRVWALMMQRQEHTPQRPQQESNPGPSVR